MAAIITTRSNYVKEEKGSAVMDASSLWEFLDEALRGLVVATVYRMTFFQPPERNFANMMRQSVRA